MQTVAGKAALCQFGRVFHTRLETFSAASMQELNYLERDPEFVAEAEKTQMTLNPIPGTTLNSMIVEGLSIPAPLNKPMLRRRGQWETAAIFRIRALKRRPANLFSE